MYLRSVFGGFCSAFLAGTAGLALVLAGGTASAQTIDMFSNPSQQWTRVGIPPTKPASDGAQWHIDDATKTIVCEGNGGHEWLRFNQELGNFELRVKWQFTPVQGTEKYNSGIFFRNNQDGSVWNQAQTGLKGGYVFGDKMVDGKITRYNLQKEMKENRVKPAGQWNTYDIRCKGTTCTLAVNGRVVNTLDTGTTRGYVGLEAEGYEITFKDFKLRELK